MKNRFLLLALALSSTVFGQVMQVVVDQDSFEVCPDQIVEVNATRTPPLTNSLTFNGSTQFVEIPNDPAFNLGTTNFSVEFWFSTNVVGVTEYLAVYRNATSTGWAILKDNNGFIGFAARDGAGAFDFMFGNITNCDDAQWHHVAVTWNRGTGLATIYVDGIFETSKNMNVGGDISHTGSITLGYGVGITGTPSYLNGEMDEFRIWSEERSSGDIQTFRSTHLNPASFPTLAVNFDFNELTNASGWYDCAAGITAPTGPTVPTVNTNGSPFTNFSFAYTWTAQNGNTQTGSSFQSSFTADDEVVVETGYCKYYTTDTVSITILDCDTAIDQRDVASVFMPTAFTPNGDTRNDTYIVKANAISYFDMTIYNRLGNILFHSRDINTGWDGTFNDARCAEGTYVCRVIYRDLEGKEYTKYEHFALMR